MRMEWLEIRDWPGHELEVPNMSETVSYMYNSGESFEFVAANMGLEGGGEGVRYFIGSPEGEKEVIRDYLEKKRFDVREGPERKPPSPDDYRIEAELEAERHYGIPFMKEAATGSGRDLPEEHVNLPDSLVSAIASGGKVRISVSRSDRAERGANRLAKEKRLNRTGGGGYQPGSNLVRGKTHDERKNTNRNHRRTARDRRLEKKADGIEKRSQSGMVACDVRIYGDNRRQIRKIKASFPFRPNGLAVHGENGEDEEKSGPNVNPEVPHPKKVLGISLSHLPAFVPLGVSFLLLIFLYKPSGTFAILVSLVEKFPGCLLDPPVWAVLLGAGSSAVLLFRILTGKNRIAFSVPELSLIMSIPKDLTRFGEKGTEPASRTKGGTFDWEDKDQAEGSDSDQEKTGGDDEENETSSDGGDAE